MKRGEPMRRTAMKASQKPLARTSTLKTTSPMSRGTKRLAAPTKPMAAVGQRAKRTGQGKVAPNAAERAWMDRIASFGCIVCWLQHGVRMPPAVHHILSGGRRMGHLYTIPLCDPGHHQGGDKVGNMISRHPWKARFEDAYGTELELLERMRAILA